MRIIDSFFERKIEAKILRFYVTLTSGPPPAAFKKARPDEGFEKKIGSDVKLYHITDASGQLVVTEIGQRPLQQAMLNHNDCYCLDQSGQVDLGMISDLFPHFGFFRSLGVTYMAYLHWLLFTFFQTLVKT